MEKLDNTLESSPNNSGADAGNGEGEKWRQFAAKDPNYFGNPCGTIAVHVQMEIEPFDDPSATDVLDLVSDALSKSPIPLLNLEGMKLMCAGEKTISVSSCNLAEYDILLTPCPFKRQSLESFPDSKLIPQIDQALTERLVSLGAENGSIAELRVLSIERNPQLPWELAEELNLFQYGSEAFDWSTGVLPHERLSNHAHNFEDALSSAKDIVEDGIHDATVESVTIEKDQRELDVWSALFTWRIEGKDGAAPHLVSGRWYYPMSPKADPRSRFHIFSLLRPWLGNEALKNVDLDLHSLVGRKCKLLVIRNYYSEFYHRSFYNYIETPIWAVLPADFQMK